MQTNDGRDQIHQVALLSLQLETQQKHLTEAENKHQTVLKRLDEFSVRDLDRQREKRDLDRRLAVMGHDLKEAIRKVSFLYFIDCKVNFHKGELV